MIFVLSQDADQQRCDVIHVMNFFSGPKRPVTQRFPAHIKNRFIFTQDCIKPGFPTL
jgi:hypothetical protein